MDHTHHDRKRILLVEDTPLDATVFRYALGHAHVHADLQVVISVAEAVKLIEQPKKVADLVILDMSLQDGTGLDVLQAIRSSPVQHLIPVVVFSASTRDDDVRLSYAHGANAYITKPSDNYPMLVEYVKTMDAFWFSTVRLPP